MNESMRERVTFSNLGFLALGVNLGGLITALIMGSKYVPMIFIIGIFLAGFFIWKTKQL